jgi:hypothetical protein
VARGVDKVFSHRPMTDGGLHRSTYTAALVPPVCWLVVQGLPNPLHCLFIVYVQLSPRCGQGLPTLVHSVHYSPSNHGQVPPLCDQIRPQSLIGP